jgi:hypothetical protein
MARMLMLTACLYTDLIDLEEAADGAAQLTELRTNLIELEKSILDPDFPFDRQVVEKRISYKESFKLQTVEQRFTISLKGQMTFASSKITALMANTTLSVMHRKRYHPNIFRDGDFIDLTIRIGGLLEQDAFSTLLQQTAHGLRNDPRTCDAAQGFADSLSDIQDSYAALAASPLDGGKGYDLTFRFYKPSKINTGWALSQTTFTAINNLTIAAKGSIPVAPAISVTVGASHDRATTSTVFIRFSPENILPWATRYVHELAAKNVVNDDGNFAAANYWDQHIKKEQRSGIEKLFKNVAREMALVRSGENLPVGGLLEQMKEIATLFARDSAFDKYALETRTENFIIAAEAYTNSTRLTEEATYHDAIKKLEELFFEYHPHIQRHKAEYQRTPKELQLQTT